MKFTDFCYHGNKGGSSENFNDSIGLADHENPTQVQNSGIYLKCELSYCDFYVEISTQKITITQLAFEIDPRILHLCGFFVVGQSNGVIQIITRPILVVMLTEIGKFHQKVGYNSACV